MTLFVTEGVFAAGGQDLRSRGGTRTGTGTEKSTRAANIRRAVGVAAGCMR